MNMWQVMLFFVLFLVGNAAAAEPAPEEVVGRPAPAWQELRVLGTTQTLESFRGNVVLIRWFSDECPLCKSTLPGLGRLYETHRKAGLVVVGVYHPKPKPRAVSEQEVRKFAGTLGIRFPVTLDPDWTVLKRFWLNERPRAYTSVTFLIDRKGIIRWVHRGGEFHESADPEHKACDAAWRELQQILPRVLKENDAP
jgi:peroxiredoxin